MNKILMIVCVVVASLAAQAQVYRSACASAVSNMPNCQGHDVLVRNYSGSNVLIHHVSESNKYEHHFALQRQDVDAMNEMVAVMGSMGEADTTYQLNDMRVLGDTCYFCGTKVVDMGEPLFDEWGNIVMGQILKQGIVGSFAVSAIAEGGEANLQMALVPMTEELTRLAVRRDQTDHTNHYRVMLTAVGRLGASYGGKSCVVEMADYVMGGWKVSVIHTGGQEVFTDAVPTTGFTFLTSFYYGENDNPDVGGRNLVIHQVSSGGYAETYAGMNQEEDAIKYDFGTAEWGWHQAGAQARMCLLPNDRVGLSFGTQNQTTGSYGIMAMSLTSNYPIDTMSVLGASPNVQVRDMEYLPFVNQLGILAWDNTYLQRGVWLAPIGHTGSVSVLSRQGTRLQSVCRYLNRTVLAGGYGTLTNNIYSIWQHPQSVERPECVSVDPTTSERLLSANEEKHTCEWTSIIYARQMQWTSIPTTQRDANQVFECAQPLWFIEITH